MLLEKKANKKDLILKTAQNLFTKFGLTKTTIDDIARMARMGKASIYYYFKSKEAIFQEVIEKEGKELRKKISETVNLQSTPQQKIHAYAITRMSEIKNLANYYNALRDDYLQHYAFIEKARVGFQNYEINLIKKILVEGIAEDVFDIQNVQLTSEAILVALKGFEYHWTLTEPLVTIQKNIEILMNMLFKGIEKRE